MTMSPLFVMTFTLIAVSLHCLKACSENGSDTQMMRSINEMCLPGYFKKNDCPRGTHMICERCYEDSFTALGNKLRYCTPCKRCDNKENKVTKSECTPEKDRVCGCKDGFYESKKVKDIMSCTSCTNCRNCTICPDCKDCGAERCGQGQFLGQDGKCQSCSNHQCKNKLCQSFCEPVPVPTPDWKVVLVIILAVLLLLGIFILPFIMACRKKQNIVKLDPEQNRDLHKPILPDVQPKMPDIHPIQISLISTKDILSDSENSHRIEKELRSMTFPITEVSKHEQEKDLWPASMLYIIIKHIPVRRWKEFLRLLSISDDQMERVEQETRWPYMEQQYQMLRIWTQRSGANLEIIYSTLHSMDLSGCAEELQEKLQQLQQIPMV